MYFRSRRKYAVSHPQGARDGSTCQLLSTFATSSCKIKVKQLPQIPYCMVVAGLRSLASFLCVCAAGQELHEEIKSMQVLDYEARIC